MVRVVAVAISEANGAGVLGGRLGGYLAILSGEFRESGVGVQGEGVAIVAVDVEFHG